MNDFAIIEGEFINLYSDDNPMLNIGDDVYFMMFNNTDYHRPLICQGIIIEDKLSDTLNKSYFVELREIHESPKIIAEFFYNKKLFINTAIKLHFYA